MIGADIMAKLGELLAELRLDRKMTQRQLSDILHVSVGTISNYEKSVHFPDIEKLSSLADFFDVTTDYLLGRCENSLSPDIFSEAVIEGKTVGDFIRTIQQLPTDRKHILATIMGDMEFRTAINRYNKGESK